MKVLIADKFPDFYVDKINELGSVSYEPGYGADDIAENINF